MRHGDDDETNKGTNLSHNVCKESRNCATDKDNTNN